MDKKKNEMQAEYDFSGGVRGKHHQAYRRGHAVQIDKRDGTTEMYYFKPEDGSVMLDPDVKRHFPNSEAVNKALRALIARS